MLWLPLASSAAQLDALVIQITDGDSIEIRATDGRHYRVRLQGIDAPEYNQPYGRQARDNLARIALHRDARIDWQKNDKYGRLVGVARVAGLDIGLAQVRAGLAWHHRYFKSEQSPAVRTSHANAEWQARDAARGLWQDAAAIPPWRWKRQRQRR